MKFICFTAALLSAVLQEQSNAVMIDAAGLAGEGFDYGTRPNEFAQRWTENYNIRGSGLTLA